MSRFSRRGAIASTRHRTSFSPSFQQTATARIASAPGTPVSKTQQATARVRKVNLTKTQTATAHIGGLTFEQVTYSARPAFSPTRTVHFSTQAGLSNAITNMLPGDLIQYNGTGVLSITSGTSVPITIANKNPTGKAVCIDFGTRKSVWDPTLESGNYVDFNYTGGGQNDCLYIHDSSNLILLGGSFSTNKTGASGLRAMGPLSNIQHFDAYVYNTGGSGGTIQPITTSGNPSSITGCYWRFESNRFCMNPTYDPHSDKGTGLHGVLLHGNSGHLDDNTVIIYAHDPLTPGETCVADGKVYPEGSGGSALEPGTDIKTGLAASTTSQNNNTFGVKGENLLMKVTTDPTNPAISNPGTTSTQTGGNILDQWGSVPQNGQVYLWLEGINITGAIYHGTTENWWKASPQIKVLHGRFSNILQWLTGQPQHTAYYTGFNIDYQDCPPAGH